MTAEARERTPGAVIDRRTVADYLVETLEASGVQRIFGLPGDSLNGLTDALRQHEKLTWLHVRHEEGAALAAAAAAATTGELAVCAASCGPGNLHLVNGLFDAQRSRVPVLAIAAHIPLAEVGTGYFQETHPQELFRECSVYAELVSNPEQLPRPSCGWPCGPPSSGAASPWSSSRVRCSSSQRRRSSGCTPSGRPRR